MTREEAITLLQSRVDLIKKNYPDIADYVEALEMAIEALNHIADDSKKVSISRGQENDMVFRQAAIDIVLEYAKGLYKHVGTPEDNGMYSYGRGLLLSIERNLKHLPSAQPDYKEVLGWLLAYHTKSFDLHGRYLPHEVISWLINDFTKEFIAERRAEE